MTASEMAEMWAVIEEMKGRGWALTLTTNAGGCSAQFWTWAQFPEDWQVEAGAGPDEELAAVREAARQAVEKFP